MADPWAVVQMVESLPTTDAPPAAAPATAPEERNPQAHGWAKAEAYDYGTYNKSNKELAEANAAFDKAADAFVAGGLHSGEWAGNAAVYEWKDEYGDVGPAFPEIEEHLFHGDLQVRTGINFSEVASLSVVQEGTARIDPVRKFEDAGLHPVLLATVKLCGYTVPTPIQQYCLPAIFKGHDVVACAQTGSGKTAAFLIPILSKLMGKAKKLAAKRPNPATYDPAVSGPIRAEPLVLIVCPTRELATQIFDEARRFCYRTMFRPAVVYGGGPLAEQIAQLAKGADILIGTPGRLVDFINRPHLLTLHRLKYMVLDEADELLQTDWEQEMKTIMSGGDQEEGNITYMMFSATFPKMARDLAKEHLKHDHVRIRVGRAGSSHMNIRQDIIFVEPQSKRQALYDMLMSIPPARTIIFVNSKRTADELDDFLFNQNMPTTSIHGDRTQREREDSIRAFRTGKTPILIATGVSARGLDIANVMTVINFDLPSPQYGGIEEYTHRIGRTGRIGNTGVATSFYNDRDADIAETLVKTLLETKQIIPDFLEQYIPEGFNAAGEGDATKLRFDADSDDEEEEERNGGEAAASGWGAPAGDAPPVATWGAEPTAPFPSTPLNQATVVSTFDNSQPSTWGAAPTHPPAMAATVPVPPTGAPVGQSWGGNPSHASVTGYPPSQPIAPSQDTSQGPVPQWGASMPGAPSNYGLPSQHVPVQAPPMGQGPSAQWIAPAQGPPINQGSQPQWNAPIQSTPVTQGPPPQFNLPGKGPVSYGQSAHLGPTAPASTGAPPPSQGWSAVPHGSVVHAPIPRALPAQSPVSQWGPAQTPATQPAAASSWDQAAATSTWGKTGHNNENW